MIADNQINYSQASNLTDEQIFQKYANCDIVNFPSLYVGFGMPIIEGQMTGIVVVTSNLSPMKEVAGGSAILVDPYDVESIKAGYVTAIQDHENWIERGRYNVERYRLPNIVKQYLDIYNELK